MTDGEQADGTARYVFGVEFRIEPGTRDVSLEPDRFGTTLFRRANPPGEDGWLFFRDNCWRGEVNDAAHLRALTEEALGVPVESVSFSELRTDEAYLAALKGEIAANLGEFNAANADEVLSKYLGSSIHVVEDPD